MTIAEKLLEKRFWEIHPKIHPWGEGILDHECREMRRKGREIIPHMFAGYGEIVEK